MNVTSTHAQSADGKGFVLNLKAGPVRPLDYSLFPQDQFCSILMAWSEKLFTVISRVPPHGVGPQAHWHDVDQLFYCTTGSLELHLGADTLSLQPGDLAVIPAGTLHEHRNLEDQEEIHLELIVPGIIPGRPIMHPIEDGDAWQGHGQVVRRAPSTPAGTGTARTWQARAADGADAAWRCAEFQMDIGGHLALGDRACLAFVLQGTATFDDRLVAERSIALGQAGHMHDLRASHRNVVFVIWPEGA